MLVMASLLRLVFVTACVSRALADVNVTDYIFWKKYDIGVWHNFFPQRFLQGEKETIEAGLTAYSSMYYHLDSSLLGIVTFPLREFQTAQLFMNGTDAEGCLAGIAGYISKAIEDASDTFKDCTEEALSKLARLEKYRCFINSTYWEAYQRATRGIDYCYKTYPDKPSFSMLMSCVKAMTDDYYRVANSTLNALFPSPSMAYIQRTVVGCASEAARSVADKGNKSLELLVDCAALIPGFDVDRYKQDLNKWEGYNDTLAQQIATCQDKNKDQVNDVEMELMEYYKLQEQALEQYVVQSRGLDYYFSQIYTYLQPYYNSVTWAALDNPGAIGCAKEAKEGLDFVASISAYTNLACDTEVVNSTILLIKKIKDSFWSLNTKLPLIGNAAILLCTAKGYMFAPNAINECFNLVASDFNMDYIDHKVIVNESDQKLREFENIFYNGTDLPCRGTTIKRLLREGDVVLFDLQRCLYISSGTNYPVTTPLPYTTTTGSSTTYFHPTTTTTQATTPSTVQSTTPSTTPSTTQTATPTTTLSTTQTATPTTTPSTIQTATPTTTLSTTPTATPTTTPSTTQTATPTTTPSTTPTATPTTTPSTTPTVNPTTTPSTTPTVTQTTTQTTTPTAIPSTTTST